jgi:hypothetical protein
MGWAGRVVRMGNTRFGCETLRERVYLEDLAVGGRIILKWILKNMMETRRLD